MAVGTTVGRAACLLTLLGVLLGFGPASALGAAPSADAHRGESDQQALATARQHFPASVSAPSVRAPGRNPGERVVRYIDDYTAQVEIGPQHTPMLVRGLAPLRGRDAAGHRTPIALDLTESGTDWRPRSPAVPVALAANVAQGVRFDRSGLRVTPVLPSHTSPQLAGETLFWGNVADDSDWLAQPIRAGVELSAQLRSPASPEEFRLRFSSPEGQVSLRRFAPLGGLPEGAAGPVSVEVRNQPTATVLPPIAFDAAGRPIDVSYRLDRADLVIEVRHRGPETTYPVLLDPGVVDSQLSSGAGWRPFTTRSDGAFGQFDGGGYLGIQPGGGFTFSAGDYGGWFYRAGGEFSVANSAFIYQTFLTMNYSAWPNSRLIDSVTSSSWNPPSAGSSVNWPSPSPYWQGYYNAGGTGLSEPHTAGSASGTVVQHCPGGVCLPTINRTAYRNNQVMYAANWTAQYYACCHSIYSTMTSADVYLNDGEDPVLSSPDPGTEPVGWQRMSPLTASATASDTAAGVRGLGIKELRLSAPARGGGTFTRSVSNSCTGAYANPCPASWNPANDQSTGAISYSTEDLPEGDNVVRLTAYDAPGNPSATREFHVKVDRTPPTLKASGPFIDNQGQPYRDDDAYELWVDASDGAEDSPTSGVIRIEVQVDGAGVATATQDCDTGGCPAELAWDLDPDDYAAGGHTVTVEAVDGAGNRTARSWQVTTAAGDEPSESSSTSAPTAFLIGDGWRLGQTNCADPEDASVGAVVVVDGGWAVGTERTLYYGRDDYVVRRCGLGGDLQQSQRVVPTVVPTGETVPLAVSHSIVRSDGSMTEASWRFPSPTDAVWGQDWAADRATVQGAVLAPTLIAGTQPMQVNAAQATGTASSADRCASNRTYKSSQMRWRDTSYDFYVNPANNPGITQSGVRASTQRIVDGARTWNQTLDACHQRKRDRFVALYSGTTNASIGNHDDGVNTFGFSTGKIAESTCDRGGTDALACTYVRCAGDCPAFKAHYIAEVDVIFDARKRWYVRRNMDDCIDNYDIWSIAAHEVGHTAGLDDTADPTQVMGSDQGGIDSCQQRRLLGLGDVRGIRKLYPR